MQIRKAYNDQLLEERDGAVRGRESTNRVREERVEEVCQALNKSSIVSIDNQLLLVPLHLVSGRDFTEKVAQDEVEVAAEGREVGGEEVGGASGRERRREKIGVREVRLASCHRRKWYGRFAWLGIAAPVCEGLGQGGGGGGDGDSGKTGRQGISSKSEALWETRVWKEGRKVERGAGNAVVEVILPGLFVLADLLSRGGERRRRRTNANQVRTCFITQAEQVAYFFLAGPLPLPLAPDALGRFAAPSPSEASSSNSCVASLARSEAVRLRPVRRGGAGSSATGRPSQPPPALASQERASRCSRHRARARDHG